ncbi:pancortin-3 [Pseudomonas viridiflava]|uniref:Cap15 family cyclic dinucleotide receptor domain-containing protein n=1 Tax=Pseudomonas viridiflava TaxID=33069 RepID=UPI000F03BB94|nr:pancortin-3 [Pseudomonas viridiflava]
MHDYAIFGHDRVAIGRWLGTASILVSGGIAQVLTFANQLTGWSGFLKASITTGAVYFILHWLFNKWVWKASWLDIPDLSGQWELCGKTLDEIGKTRFEWGGEIGITQNWQHILIHLKTSQSQSWSYTATLAKRHSPLGGWLLTYSYTNDPEVESVHELSAHRGYCEAEISKDLMRGKIRYFNHSGRNTFGVIDIKRKM